MSFWKNWASRMSLLLTDYAKIHCSLAVTVITKSRITQTCVIMYFTERHFFYNAHCKKLSVALIQLKYCVKFYYVWYCRLHLSNLSKKEMYSLFMTNLNMLFNSIFDLVLLKWTARKVAKSMQKSRFFPIFWSFTA